MYAAVLTAGACAVLLARRRLSIAVATAFVVVAGMAVPLVANQALERATAGGAIRAPRAGAVAIDSGRSDASVRLQEGVLTLSGLTASLERRAELTGLILLGLLLVFARVSVDPGQRRPAVVAGVGVALLYLLRFGQGLGFVPGLIATTPIAAVGAAHGWKAEAASGDRCFVRRPPARLGAAVHRRRAAAMGRPLPARLRAAARRRGHHGPRPAPGVGAGRVDPGRGRHHRLRPGVDGGAHARRGARLARVLTERPEQALLFREPHLAREAGAFYDPERRWLTADSRESQERASTCSAPPASVSWGSSTSSMVRPTPRWGGGAPGPPSHPVVLRRRPARDDVPRDLIGVPGGVIAARGSVIAARGSGGRARSGSHGTRAARPARSSTGRPPRPAPGRPSAPTARGPAPPA